MVEKKVTDKSEVEEFLEIGGSPVPGLILRHVLRGHTDSITRIAWSSNGRYLASPAWDKTIRIWDSETGNCITTLRGHTHEVSSIAWSPNGRMLASSSLDKSIRIWSTETWETISILTKHIRFVLCLAWSPNGKVLLSGSADSSIRCWNTENWQTSKILTAHGGAVWNLAWSPNGDYWASGADDQQIYIYDKEARILKSTSKDNSDWIWNLAWMPDSKTIASTSKSLIKFWRLESHNPTHQLEGHVGAVKSISVSSDGLFLASKANDDVLFWRTDSWELLATVSEVREPIADEWWGPGIAFHPTKPVLATLGENDTCIRIWEIDKSVLLGQAKETVNYITAKLVLVGDSGVGKTGLGWRLAHNEFKEHASTHGQQFWVVPELKKTREDGTECEAVLWDLAGQPDYRLVHSLYLDAVDTALVLFDPTNRKEPLAGVDFWLNQLKDKDKKLRKSILIGARTDRGTSTLTDAELQAYCERNGITGGYVPTSAKEGDGVADLLEKLKTQIPWDEMTTTVTTVTFKRIKEFVLALKEKTERKNVLVQPAELREKLQAIEKDWGFSDAEMMTAVGHLETHGYVKIIHGSNGEQSILLAPDVLANLASSIVLEARRNPRGLGVLEEARLLRGDYPFQELSNLSENERKILLDAAAVLFLERNVCFRETFGEQTFLVFPSLINEKRPADETLKTEEGASYRVKGAVETIYASLVVLLGYTNTFIRTHQWQNQAQYEMGEGEICGFQQTDFGDGGLELVLYYGLKTPESVRLMFRGMFERFISRRELEISRYQPVKCTKCSSLLARNVVLERLNEGEHFSFCHKCGTRVSLPSPEALTRLSPKEEIELDAQQAIAAYRTAFEAALVRVKALLRDQGREEKPTCFIIYAWGISENERWVLQLAKDLRNAEIDVLLDRWHSPPGSNLDLYLERIDSSKFVIVVGTPELRQKYDTRKSDPVVAAELKLINLRVRQPSAYGETVLPVLLTGDPKTSFTPQLQPLVSVDFRETELYFRKLFDMIWRLYDLPFDNPLLEELQASMTPRKSY